MAIMGYPQPGAVVPVQMQQSYGSTPTIQAPYQPSYTQAYPAQQPYYGGGQQSYAAPAQAPLPKVMEYVDGEVGALTFRQPAGWPANVSIPLWDSQAQLIYFKAWDPMGRSYPLAVAKYEWASNEPQKLLPPGQSGAQAIPQTEQHADYATKEDMEQLKQEFRGIAQQMLANQNGMSQMQQQPAMREQQGQNNRNRGGQNA